ncbi:MAG TPA: hypothetical protein VGX27_14025 [Candidatus Dormibacteraeota bacterium]|nr:hypothetical protein [Candidatus Dormibacteraeota bacterium]
MFRPVYKGMANVTTEGAEVSLEGKLENKLLTPGLTFKLLEVKCDEEKKVRFMNLIFFVETGHKFDHYFANGLDGTIEIKGTFEFEFQPNWAWPGWRSIATEIAQAVRTGASFIRSLLVVEETGAATTTAAVGTAALVGAACVAWVVYGLYQIGKAHERGRREAVLNNFAAGYADVLSLLIGDLKSVRASEAMPLLGVDWKADVTNAIGTYQHGESLFIPVTANRAGRAAVIQDLIAIVEYEGVEGWNARAARLRKQYGETSWERRRTIGDRLLAQVARGDETIGIRLE